MKFKDISNNEINIYIEDVRFNENTHGKHFTILNGKYDEEKKYIGTINILSIYIKIKKLENKNSNELINQIFNKKNEGMDDFNEI